MASLGCSKPRGGATDLQGSAGAEPRPTLLWPPSSQSPRGLPGWAGNRAHWAGLQPSRARSSLLSPENFLEGGVGYTCQDFKGGPRIYPRGGCCIYGRVMHLQGAEPPRRGATSPRGISRTRGSCIMGGGISHPRGSQPPRGKWCPSRGDSYAREIMYLGGGNLMTAGGSSFPRPFGVRSRLGGRALQAGWCRAQARAGVERAGVGVSEG